jgi:outer membrane protein, heavy metal efflux system
MKLKIMVFLIFSLIYVSSLSADYSEMNQSIENYSPPGFYTDVLEQNRINEKNIKPPSVISDEVLSKIKGLKINSDNATKTDQKIDFLPAVDAKIFDTLSSMSFNKEDVEKRIGSKLKLNEIEIIAGLRNPAVLASKNKIKAELESFDQVMNLDDTLKQYTAFTKGMNNKAGPLKMKQSLKQKFPYPGLTSLKGGIIQHQVSSLIEKMKIIQKKIITETRKAYWNLVFIERSIGITSETIDAFNRLKDVATILYKSGKTSFQDIIKINIKIEILKEDLVTLSSKKNNIEVRLRELLNLPADTHIGGIVLTKADKKISPFKKLYPFARKNRQELKVIQYQIGKVQNMIEMAESMIQDRFTLNFSTYEDQAINSVGSDAKKLSFSEKTMASMKNNTPVKPWYGVDNPWLNQTRQNLLSLKHTLVKQENATDRMVRTAWFMVDKNKRELGLYKNRILPLSKSALDVSAREYESGSIPFSQAIGSYTDWLKIKLTIAKKQTDLAISIANLEKIIGISF